MRRIHEPEGDIGACLRLEVQWGTTSRQHLYWKFLSVKRGVTDAVRKRIDLCRANRVVREYWLECAAVCSPDQLHYGRSELQAEHTCGGVLVGTPYRFAADCRRGGLHTTQSDERRAGKKGVRTSRSRW